MKHEAAKQQPFETAQVRAVSGAEGVRRVVQDEALKVPPSVVVPSGLRWRPCSGFSVKPRIVCNELGSRMKIGELAAASDTAVETIRYYERERLLPEPARTESNYRSYDQAHLARLQFIRYCRGLDMSLDEVRVLLRFKDLPHENCADVNAVLDEHIGHVSRRIRELRALEKELKELRSRCGEIREAQACGILEGLSRASSTPKKTRGHLKGVHGPT